MLTGGLVAALAAASVAPGVGAPVDRLPTLLPATGYEARPREHSLDLPRGRAEELRRDALARAVLWSDPEPVRGGGPEALARAGEAACRFHLAKVDGTTPKFLCVFEGGEVFKVKYGANPEIHTEVAATRLLRALGAGADSVFLLERLRCFGCPDDPQAMLRCISPRFEDWVRSCAPIYGERTATGGLEVRIDYGRYVDFAPVAVERRLDARTVADSGGAGWGFDELDRVQGDHGRAQRDALRLVAVLLDNWDTQRDNQRLVCLDAHPDPARGCRHPLAYMQDVGASFGRGSGRGAQRKLDLEGWRSVPVWKDEAACVVKLDAPPFRAPTFGEAVISERGRLFLARRLRRLGEGEVRDAFAAAGFGESPRALAGGDLDDWVRVFQDKVRQISERKPCPTP